MAGCRYVCGGAGGRKGSKRREKGGEQVEPKVTRVCGKAFKLHHAK
jgi:hypothetical protein